MSQNKNKTGEMKQVQRDPSNGGHLRLRHMTFVLVLLHTL